MLHAHGVDFKRHRTEGIEMAEFAELLITSGIVLNDEIRWLSFHSSFDFSYLLNLLTNTPLPATETEFFNSILLFFPCIYDIKQMMRKVDGVTGGLQKMCDTLNVGCLGDVF